MWIRSQDGKVLLKSDGAEAVEDTPLYGYERNVLKKANGMSRSEDVKKKVARAKCIECDTYHAIDVDREGMYGIECPRCGHYYIVWVELRAITVPVVRGYAEERVE